MKKKFVKFSVIGHSQWKKILEYRGRTSCFSSRFYSG